MVVVGRNHGWQLGREYGAVSGPHRDDSLSKPLDCGNMRVKVKFPRLDCKVGTAFPDAMLQNDAGRYELQGRDHHRRAPDGVALNYGKVRARAGMRQPRRNNPLSTNRCRCPTLRL